jgi:hypothetical protein
MDIDSLLGENNEKFNALLICEVVNIEKEIHSIGLA